MGATVPFLLEESDDDRFLLGTECCIPGVMDGELLDKFEAVTLVIE